MTVAWLKEPHEDKTRFFQAIAKADHGGRAMRTWTVSFRSHLQTTERAEECLARAKKQPRWFGGRWLKRAFLKGRYNRARRYFGKNQDQVAVCWQGLTGARRAFMMGAIDAGADTLFAELAPLPGFKTLDPLGVNAEGSVPQDREAYDNTIARPDILAGIAAGFQPRASRRSDVGQAGTLPKNTEPFIFVPLQVPNDSQMLLFADWVQSSKGFVEALAAASQHLPDGWHLRLKEHPSSKIRLTRQIEKAIKNGARIILDNATDSFEQLKDSRAVLTVNSSMGLQAMFFDKPVITTGRAFYAMPGLTSHASSPKRLADLLDQSEQLSFDPDFRARFLTWLATDYYIKEDELGYDRLHLQNRLAEARA